jgi:large subunit ribosomal protein L23
MSKEQFYDTILSPAITEKGTLVSAHNQVVFNVAPGATKPQIKAAVEGLFGVKVKAVNTLVRKGKTRRFRGRKAQLSDVKKAYVTLAEGEKLDVTTGL